MAQSELLRGFSTAMGSACGGIIWHKVQNESISWQKVQQIGFIAFSALIIYLPPWVLQ